MQAARRMIQGANRALNILQGLALVAMLLFAGYALLDTYLVLAKADSAGLTYFQPKPGDESNPSLLELMEINPEVKAWVTLENTRISYPVLHTGDNVFYLNHDVYKEYSLAGSAFLDYRNTPDFSDSYAVLYGHNMDGGMMFADLKKYESEAFFAENQTGYLFFPDKTYELEIYAYLHEDVYQTPIFSMVEGEEAYENRLSYIRENAVHYREMGVDKTQQILVLSTCSSASTNDRAIVIAKMVEQITAGGVQQTP